MIITEGALKSLLRKIQVADKVNTDAIGALQTTVNGVVNTVALSEDGNSIVVTPVAGEATNITLPSVPTDYVTGLSIDGKTGIITINKKDGKSDTIDTLLEKVVTNFDYNTESEKLVLTLEDGTTKEVSMSAFIDTYVGSTGTEIKVSVDGSTKAISAELVDGSIAEKKLNKDLTDKLAGLRTDITTLQGTSHTHDNAAQLAKLTEDETGNPTYGGTKLLRVGDIDTTEITSSTIDTLWAEVQNENQV